VRNDLRPGDFLFRIGGDEFCCLLPETTAGQALQIAERVRGKVMAATLEASRTSVKTTLSVGIASTETFGYDLDTLMHRGDMAVYTAKRKGKNRVVVASAADSSSTDLPMTVARRTGA
jgi:diguanylate cyclase (GGDEF)-like protein